MQCRAVLCLYVLIFIYMDFLLAFLVLLLFYLVRLQKFRFTDWGDKNYLEFGLCNKD